METQLKYIILEDFTYFRSISIILEVFFTVPLFPHLGSDYRHGHFFVYPNNTK